MFYVCLALFAGVLINQLHDPGSRNCAMFVRYICTQYQ